TMKPTTASSSTDGASSPPYPTFDCPELPGVIPTAMNPPETLPGLKFSAQRTSAPQAARHVHAEQERRADHPRCSEVVDGFLRLLIDRRDGRRNSRSALARRLLDAVDEPRHRKADQRQHETTARDRPCRPQIAEDGLQHPEGKDEREGK